MYYIHPWKALIFFLACMTLSGCAMTNDMLSGTVQKPEVAIDTVGVSGITPDAIGLTLTLNVANPNNYALALAGYDYDVKFNGMPLVNGSTDQGFRIPAGRTERITIPLTVTFRDARRIYNSMGETGEVTYNADVDLRLDAPVLNLFKLSTRKQGTLTIPRFPKISFGDIRVERFSFSDIELALSMAVDNPNDFAMKLKDFMYRINVGGEPWISGGVSENIAIGKQQISRITLPLSVRLSELSAGLLSSLKSGGLDNFAVEGSFILDGDHPALQNIRVPISFQPGN
ncbi:MAG: LEA type 2 family protein [Ketobacteraceae bacterium]|nr:LEA type 2 family protein [Ketobacteraceae bacterium]